MSALTVHEVPAPGRAWDEAVRIWEQTGVPEGCKVEIVEGIVTVSPPPANTNNAIADLVQRRLYTVVPEDRGIFQTLGVAVPSGSGTYVPDLVVASRAALKESGGCIPAAAAELVVEIPERLGARHDRENKRVGYAQAAVPLYLLVDLHAPSGPLVTLYGEPSGDVYKVLSEGKFGEEIHLPAPFELTLDTSEFPTVK